VDPPHYCIAKASSQGGKNDLKVQVIALYIAVMMVSLLVTKSTIAAVLIGRLTY
jgi:hypothetical protein